MKPSQLFLRLWVCLEGCSVHIQGCTAAHSSEQRWLGLRGECPRLRSWDVQWQSYGRGLAWVLSPIDVVGGGAADHAAPVLTALPLPAAAVLLLYYGRSQCWGMDRAHHAREQPLEVLN